MTAKELKYEVDVNLRDIEFEYKGVSGAICPFGRDDIAVSTVMRKPHSIPWMRL